jgi:hypothetical protein
MGGLATAGRMLIGSIDHPRSEWVEMSQGYARPQHRASSIAIGKSGAHSTIFTRLNSAWSTGNLPTSQFKLWWGEVP